MNKQQIINDHSTGIGGTAVAAILGQSRYATPLDIYNRILFQPEIPDNPKMKAGRMLEPIIRKLYEEASERKVETVNNVIRHQAHDFLIAHIDGLIKKTDAEPSDGVLEIKNVEERIMLCWKDGLSNEYFCQIQHYLDVCGLEWGEFAFLVNGWDLQRRFIQRDNEFIELKNDKLISFWNNNVVNKIAPEPINVDDIKKYFKTEKGKSIEIVPDNFPIIEEMQELADRIKNMELAYQEREDRLKLIMRDAEILTFGGDEIATWKKSKDSSRFDSKLFRVEQPELYKKYCYLVEGSRRFIVK